MIPAPENILSQDNQLFIFTFGQKDVNYVQEISYKTLYRFFVCLFLFVLFCFVLFFSYVNEV